MKKIVIVVGDGQVETVFSNEDVEVEVVDFDSTFSKEEQKEKLNKEKEALFKVTAILFISSMYLISNFLSINGWTAKSWAQQKGSILFLGSIS